MSRQYPPHSTYSAPYGTRRSDDSADQHPGHARYGDYDSHGGGSYGSSRRYSSRADRTGSTETVVLDDADEFDYDADLDVDYEDYDDYAEPIDRRWIWVAGVAGVILLVAVICTVVILGGGDSGSVSKTVSPPAATTSQAPTTSVAPPVATSRAPLPPAAPLTPETVTTVAPEPTASAAPTPTAPAVAAPDPRTITYQVTGTRQLLDMITVIYTDQQGALQTELNVALPWTKTVVLDPGVTLTSVTATSLLGKLDCSITDAGGATIAAQANNTMITTCTK
ncbi:hypothetical protein CIW52_25715 [Mycolicibacterium sp. P9-64]|uniref:hypothetical protein n=1 Tax=Mycolicibacterium sp. P9-64 TaxID=2024612 RepID=UPI0011EF7087|nr:hypothetical protein [Mycolicibacterium sp. P9-64]KAA0080178.1 hypothetical protein CIW52_25715 [Mycolicibacterium sp. P9-64]